MLSCDCTKLQPRARSRFDCRKQCRLPNLAWHLSPVVRPHTQFTLLDKDANFTYGPILISLCLAKKRAQGHSHLPTHAFQNQPGSWEFWYHAPLLNTEHGIKAQTFNPSLPADIGHELPAARVSYSRHGQGAPGRGLWSSLKFEVPSILAGIARPSPNGTTLY